MWILKNYQTIFYRARIRRLCHLAILLKDYFTTIYRIKLLNSKLKDKLNVERQFLFCSIKKTRPTYIQLCCLREGLIRLRYSASSKKKSESSIIKMLDFLYDTIIVYFGGRILNKQSAFPREPTVPIFQPFCSFIHLNLTSSTNLF